jgi:hypothetical protein
MDTETEFTLVSYNYWMVKTTFPAPSFFKDRSDHG